MILIPSYNCEDYIADTIESAINQTLKVPVYLIDNCSTDKTIEIAKKFNMSERSVDSFLKDCLGKYLLQPKTGWYEKVK